ELENIHALNIAMNDSDQRIPYYEFSDQYSEYNSIMANQYENESWFNTVRIEKTHVDGLQLDTVSARNNLMPTMIKIDVEGAEANVIRGAKGILENYFSIVIMEFLADPHRNQSHQEAHRLLLSHDFHCFLIDSVGNLQPCTDPIQQL